MSQCDEEAVCGLAAFGMSLFAQVASMSAGGGVVLICPLSVAGALALVAAGATPASKTEGELLSTLRVSAADKVAEATRAMLSESGGGVSLRVANSVWTSKAILPSYVNLAQTTYDAHASPLPPSYDQGRAPPRQPISPICRTPIFPISQNSILFLESFISPPRQPISPICRTPLFPISQNFNSFLGRWGSAIRIECGWGQRRGTCNCGWRCWGDTFRRADRRPCGRRCRCGRRTVAGGAPSSVAVGVSRPNRSVPIPRGWRRFPIPRGWRRAAIGVSRPNRSAPTPRGWRRAAIPRGWRRAAIWVSRPNRSVPIPRGWRRAPIGVSRPNIRTTRSAPTPRGWRRAYVDAIHTRWRRAHTALLGAGASAPSGGPAPAGGGGSTRASPGALRSASTRGTGLCIKARACCCLFVHMSGMHHHPT